MRSAVVFSLGFFSLVAQTLLFRDFLTVFEGNELGVGGFFASWLLWVGLGALAGRAVCHFRPEWARRFELLTLLYAPAFLLQQWMIAHSRRWGGVAAYELYPFARMFLVALAVNSPISFLTGWLFTLACRWRERESVLPAARVYVLEAGGGFVGGVGVTGALAGGASAETIFLAAVFVLAGAAALSLLARPAAQRSPPSWATPLGLLAVVALLAASGLGGRWTQWRRRAAWGRLLPVEAYRGAFATAQARYLYGQRDRQFLVMSWGGVSETLPNEQHASEIVALSLAQNPKARRVLVVGTGSLSVCLRFREIPQIERVAWLHPDPEYPGALRDVLPASYREAVGRIETSSADARRWMRRRRGCFDLVLLNLPDATTLALNRYWTREFFRLAKGALADGGVLCARLSGGANYVGGELAYIGAAAVETIESVFSHTALKPGEESWLIASDSRVVSGDPAVLRDRFAAIPGAAAVYPPEGLLSLYLPDRSEFQLSKYRERAAALAPRALLNTDRQPKALLLSMLLALRRTDLLSLAENLPILLAAGAYLAACPILIYGLLRLVYRLAPRSRRVEGGGERSEAFDGGFLVFSTGLAGMSLSIYLMLLYQSQFGSLFLYVGFISSLFMLGSFLGGAACRRAVARQAASLRSLTAGCLAVHLLLIGYILFLPAGASPVVYSILFAGCGFFVGVYFPIAADRFRASGRSAAASGGRLEMLDHLGGASGATATGWLLLPVLGGPGALCILGLLVAVNLIPACVRARTVRLPGSVDWFDRLTRPAAYCMFGVGACLLIGSGIVQGVETGREGRRLLAAAREMVPSGVELTRRETRTEDGEPMVYYEAAGESPEAGGYIFSTSKLAQGVSGYGGPIVLAVYMDRSGVLRDLRILQSHETPAYVESLRGWLRGLPGWCLFEPQPPAGVDAVSGATMTSEAVLRTLDQSGRGFAAAVLGLRGAGPNAAAAPRRLDGKLICLALLLALALLLRRRPGAWRRRALLLGSLAVTGVFLNLQYSTQQVAALLSWRFPGNWLGGSFFLMAVVPLVVLLFGNVYCGYVCPFGALQELIGEARPARWATDPPKRLWRYGRAVKYVLLLLLISCFALTADYAVLSADPLITIFSPLRGGLALALGIVILALSVVFRRFWCRNLCPAGAFLSLLSGVRLFRGVRPPPAPSRCDLGVRNILELDCLCCDRCRHEKD